jgi:hypothetical protein
VTGKGEFNRPETTRLYKHHDGYPTGNLPVIFEALRNVQAQCDQAELDYGGKYTPKVGQTVGHLIGAATSVYGMGATVDDGYSKASFSEDLKPEHLGEQCDLEWIYIISLEDKTISIYGGGYSGKTPQVQLEKGVVNPISYVKSLLPEYRKAEKTRIEIALKQLEEIGFKIAQKKGRSGR